MQWINTEIAEGRMTLDESTNYVSMTISGMPAVKNGDPLSANDAWRDQPRDYINDLALGVDGAISRGDKEEEKRLRSMLDRLKGQSEANSPQLGCCARR